MLRERFGLSGSMLKMIAVITMLIDHVAAVLIVKWLIAGGVLELMDYNGSRVMMLLTSEHGDVISIYQFMRNVGRIAFPIYCFMLVEGFMKTCDVKKYLGRMLAAALISEIPFDLAFAGKVIYRDYQNVMFTLVWGLLAMMISFKAETKLEKWYLKLPAVILTWIAAAAAAEFMMTDYGAKGVLCIGALYIFRYDRIRQLLAGAIAFLWEIPAPVSFLFIGCYNGKRGASWKQFFYAFYPVHLMILYLISVWMGMGNVAVI